MASRCSRIATMAEGYAGGPMSSFIASISRYLMAGSIGRWGTTACLSPTPLAQHSDTCPPLLQELASCLERVAAELRPRNIIIVLQAFSAYRISVPGLTSALAQSLEPQFPQPLVSLTCTHMIPTNNQSSAPGLQTVALLTLSLHSKGRDCSSRRQQSGDNRQAIARSNSCTARGIFRWCGCW